MFLTVVTKRFQIELSHFRVLSKQAQHLLRSFTLYELSLPLINIFSVSFLLRQAEGFWLAGLYNMAQYIALPSTFYLNGYLLKYFSVKQLYRVGAIGQGLFVTILFLFPLASPQWVLFFGIGQGFFLGLYWANRNFLSYAETEDTQRNYFTGIELLLQVLLGILVPVGIGAVLFVAQRLGLAVERGYQFLGFMSVITLWLSGQVLMTSRVREPRIRSVWITQASSSWWRARWIQLLRGFQNNLEFILPAFITFTLIGKETQLATLQSLAAIFSAIVLYASARKTTREHRVRIVGGGVALLGIVSCIFSFFFTSWAGVFYLVSIGFIMTMTWLALNPFIMSIMDEEEKKGTSGYAFVCDNELFLNIGRSISLGCLFLLLHFSSSSVAVRWLPLAGAATMVAVYWMVRKVEKE